MNNQKSFDFWHLFCGICVLTIVLILILMCELPFLTRTDRYDQYLLPEKPMKSKSVVASKNIETTPENGVLLVH